MKQDGLQRLLDFLNLLREHGVDFRLGQEGPDGVMVLFALYGVRIEADFTIDEMQYSIFKGDENVLTNVDDLVRLIKERSQ